MSIEHGGLNAVVELELVFRMTDTRLRIRRRLRDVAETAEQIVVAELIRSLEWTLYGYGRFYIIRTKHKLHSILQSLLRVYITRIYNCVPTCCVYVVLRDPALRYD